jgi:hypothetical protein
VSKTDIVTAPDMGTETVTDRDSYGGRDRRDERIRLRYVGTW